jgi:hypothetical protein
MNNRQNGYVALISVLIVGAASVSIALGLLLAGTDAQRSTLVSQNAAQARSLAAACAEEALQRIHDDQAYTGTANLTLSSSSCQLTVTNTGSNNRTIDTSATINGVVRKVKVYVTITALSISVTSWQEVADA